MKFPVGAPTAPDPAPWQFPQPSEETVLDSGLTVRSYHRPGQQVVSAALVLRTPLNSEPAGAEGVATICARVLDEGTTELPGAEFARELESSGAALGVAVHLATTNLLLDVPGNRLATALPLLAAAVSRPALAAADVNRHIQIRLAEIAQALANSAATAAIAFRRHLFTPDSRAGRMTGGEAETVRQLNHEQVRAHHLRAYRPEQATLILGGDFPTSPVPAVAAAFAGWKSTSEPTLAYQPGTYADPVAVLVDRPGAVAADIRIGGRGIDRHDPRWAALSVAANALGGSFLSRINKRLREELGYTYGAHLALNPTRGAGWFWVQGSFRTEVVVPALAETRRLLDITANPFSAAEVAQTQRYVIGRSLIRHATAAGIVDQAVTQTADELGPDFLSRQLAAVAAVTPESATTAYQEIVGQTDFTLVVVGDADRLAEPLRQAGWSNLLVVELRPVN